MSFSASGPIFVYNITFRTISNTLIFADEQVLVADFAIARILQITQAAA